MLSTCDLPLGAEGRDSQEQAVSVLHLFVPNEILTGESATVSF